MLSKLSLFIIVCLLISLGYVLFLILKQLVITRKKSTLFIKIIFVLVGVGLLFYGSKGLIVGYESTKWPTCQGEIIYSSVRKIKSARYGTSYKPDITYKYSVNNKSFTGNRIRTLSPNYKSAESAQEKTNLYPVGSKIAIYYHPQAPDKSLLIVGIHQGSYVILAFGLLLLLTGFFAYRGNNKFSDK